MKCSTCGNCNPGKARFCGECGTPIGSADEEYFGTSYQSPTISFTSAIQLGFKRYFDFKGRSTRGEYWWWMLFLPLGSLILGVTESTVLGRLSPIFLEWQILSTIFRIALLIPSLAVGVRRLHDINRTGWWLLAMFGWFLFIIPGLIMTVVLVAWACKRGDSGPNKHGPAPWTVPAY
ncbi:zinc-ribbon domain-containing protein [Dehalococcoidia bacterium]|nr:zinc-ribbon domain-containing protein [Dehalococcoidia bacterium]